MVKLAIGDVVRVAGIPGPMMVVIEPHGELTHLFWFDKNNEGNEANISTSLLTKCKPWTHEYADGK